MVQKEGFYFCSLLVFCFKCANALLMHLVELGCDVQLTCVPGSKEHYKKHHCMVLKPQMYPSREVNKSPLPFIPCAHS